LVFAGPIVIEWYWIPILIVVGVGMPVATVAVIAEVILRAPRRSGRLTWGKRARMWGIVAGTLMLLSLVFDVALPRLLQDREARATARAFDFTPHEPRSPVFAVQAVNGTLDPPRLERHLMIVGSAATAIEQRPRGPLVAHDGGCALAEQGPKRFACRELRTPGGISVYLATSRRSQFSRRTAFAVLDGTLVRLMFEPMEDKYVAAYFDSLRPVEKDEIEFTPA
jgi:hypothetical protein